MPRRDSSELRRPSGGYTANWRFLLDSALPPRPPASSSPDMKPPRAPLAEPPPPPNVRLHWGGELFTYSLKQSV